MKKKWKELEGDKAQKRKDNTLNENHNFSDLQLDVKLM
jgi:hypothetical protein